MIFVFSCILEFIVVTAHIRAGKKNRGEMVNFLLLLYLSHLILILIDTNIARIAKLPYGQRKALLKVSLLLKERLY